MMEERKSITFYRSVNGVWLDISPKRFAYVHPAGGNEFTSVKLTPEELESASNAKGWVDVCKGWE